MTRRIRGNKRVKSNSCLFLSCSWLSLYSIVVPSKGCFEPGKSQICCLLPWNYGYSTLLQELVIPINWHKNFAYTLMDETFRPFDWHRIFFGDAPLLFLLEIVLRTLIMY